MKIYYCWKCKKQMPFLDESEWLVIEPYLVEGKQSLQAFRAINNCDLATARKKCKYQAMKVFEKLTGVPDIHFDVIWHHRLSDWGQECNQCGELIRTPKASFCANCNNKMSS